MADLKYGLPELLINIEMAIFSVLHLWAFAWKPYALQPGEVTDFYGNGKESYQGGKFGFKALVDAMNPLDLFKAIGRGGRWLFVGRKNRTQDSSYRPQDQSIGLESSASGPDGTSYQGAGTAMSGARKTRYAGDEEGEVLLANAQSNPEAGHFGTSPYSEADEYLSEQPGRFYQSGHGNSFDQGHVMSNEHSPYDDIEQQNIGYTHDGLSHPYPADGPLREQAPMPMPDPYQPPPPYPDDHSHPHS